MFSYCVVYGDNNLRECYRFCVCASNDRAVLLLCIEITFAICDSSPSSVANETFGLARKISNTVLTLSTVVSDTLPSRLDNRALPDRNTWDTEPPMVARDVCLLN